LGARLMFWQELPMTEQRLWIGVERLREDGELSYWIENRRHRRYAVDAVSGECAGCESGGVLRGDEGPVEAETGDEGFAGFLAEWEGFSSRGDEQEGETGQGSGFLV
jgi:hypothetical protein